MTVSPAPSSLSRPQDARLLLLAAFLLAVAVWFPWIGLRPNRIAPPAFLALAPGLKGAALLLPALLGVAALRRPRLAWIPAGLVMTGGVVALGLLTRGALAGQSEIARASASSGFWIWMLGAGMALYGAGTALQGAARLLNWLWLPVCAAWFLAHGLDAWSVLAEGRNVGERWTAELLRHIWLVTVALGVALLIGAPLAVWSSRNARASAVVLSVAGAFQTVPSLALLGLLIAPLAWLANTVPALRAAGVSGIGSAPALVALTLYALLPILRNGVVALGGVDSGALDAARGMGMTDAQRFWRVQLPLALPVWLAGVRQATVLLVGVTSVAVYIGAGGLGTYIQAGLNNGAADLILLGALPACVLAVVADALLRGAERLLSRRFGNV